MLTPSLPLSRPVGLPVCLARFPAARLWLKDESLEDSANLPDPDVIAPQLIQKLPFPHPSGLPVHVDRSRELHCRRPQSEEHTSELQSHSDLVCRLLLEKKKK